MQLGQDYMTALSVDIRPWTIHWWIQHVSHLVLCHINVKVSNFAIFLTEVSNILSICVMVGCSWMIRELDANGVLDAVRTLIQHVCTKVPDRTEYRAKISQVCVLCWVGMIRLYNQSYVKLSTVERLSLMQHKTKPNLECRDWDFRVQDLKSLDSGVSRSFETVEA